MRNQSWKHDSRLTNLDAGQEIEMTCLRCRKMRYETPEDLLEIDGMKHLYCNQLEMSLYCADQWCKGGIRIALIYGDKLQGFVSGVA